MGPPDINLMALAPGRLSSVSQQAIGTQLERDPFSNTRIALCSALGFTDTADNPDMEALSFESYLDYIESSWPGRGSKKDFLRLFADVAGSFRGATLTPGSDGHDASESTRSIQQYIDDLVASPDHYYFPDTLPGSPSRATSVTEIVLLILGTWLLMQSYFVPMRRDQRCIILAFCFGHKRPYSEPEGLAISPAHLVSQGGLLPSADEVVGSGSGSDSRSSSGPGVCASTPVSGEDNQPAHTPFQLHSSIGLLESLSVSPRRLNAVKLASLGRVEFVWTANISRHLLLSRRGEQHCLELFALPCALQTGAENVNPFVKMGILSAELVDEIDASYATLFRPVKASRVHRVLARLLGLQHWCWCLDCASYRLRRQVLAPLKMSEDKYERGLVWHHTVTATGQFRFDARLGILMQRDASQWQWDRTEFRELWPRILALDAHLEQTRPWSFWVIFRDRRDTVQYWTFL